MERTVWLAGWVALASAATFGLVALDKGRARRGGPRVRERTLLAWALAGGSPGLLMGMILARHKVRKTAFLGRVVLVLSAQAVVAWWMLGR